MPFSMTGMSSMDMLRSTARRLAASAPFSICPRLAGASACRHRQEQHVITVGSLPELISARDRHVYEDTAGELGYAVM